MSWMTGAVVQVSLCISRFYVEVSVQKVIVKDESDVQERKMAGGDTVRELDSGMDRVDVSEEGLKFRVRFSPEEKDIIYVSLPEGCRNGHWTASEYL